MPSSGGGCLPYTSSLVPLVVEVRFTRSVDRFCLGIREEINTSLDVTIHIARHEELTYRWLVNETRIQFKLETGIYIEDEQVFGLYSYSHKKSMNFGDEILQTFDDLILSDGEADFKHDRRFKLITTGPFQLLSDRLLLEVGYFVGPNPNCLAKLCKVSTRFRRV